MGKNARTFGQDLMRGEYTVGGGMNKRRAAMVPIKISAKMARQGFHECEAGYIKDVCHGACCRHSTRGAVVHVLDSEREALSDVQIDAAGMLVPVNGRCPFQTKDELCGLHGRKEKPFGCQASPFTINKTGTLIIRNRYRMFKCYKDGGKPAYQAFSQSLVAIFGPDEAERIKTHLDGGGGDITANAPKWIHDAMMQKNATSKPVKTIGTTSRMNDKGLSGGCSDGDAAVATGTSIFDPVLTELAYRWFSPKGGLILDPFAGGSVRGIVAAKLGREYIGYELRKEQVEANRVQADDICSDIVPAWVNDDSKNISLDIEADMVFSCPPYADLEVYSDDPKDLSTMPYEQFIESYSEIIGKACRQLKADRFAVFVVGEVRNKAGGYYNFVGDTVQAFKDAGLTYYNEMILVTAVGSLPIRVGRQFDAGRKIGKTHQNVLVFLKGDAKKATLAIGAVEFGEITEAGVSFSPELVDGT